MHAEMRMCWVRQLTVQRPVHLDSLHGGQADQAQHILFFGSDRPEVQLSVMRLDIKAHIHPDVSIEVDDVDAVYQRAVNTGSEIVYPLTDEDWGLRRFFVRDPNGSVINVTQHG